MALAGRGILLISAPCSNTRVRNTNAGKYGTKFRNICHCFDLRNIENIRAISFLSGLHLLQKRLILQAISRARRCLTWIWSPSENKRPDAVGLKKKAGDFHMTEQDAQLLVKTSTAARRLDVSRSTIHRWVQSGELPSVLIGGCRRIPESELVKFAEGNRGKRATNDARPGIQVPDSPCSRNGNESVLAESI